MPTRVDTIFKAIKKKNPKMSDSKAWAIAYSQFNKENNK